MLFGVCRSLLFLCWLLFVVRCVVFVVSCLLCVVCGLLFHDCLCLLVVVRVVRWVAWWFVVC